MLTVPEVAERLECSPGTVYTLIREGRLAAIRRLGNPRGAWLVKPDALEQFAQAQEPEPLAAGVA